MVHSTSDSGNVSDDPTADFGRHLASLDRATERDAAISRAKVLGAQSASRAALNEPTGLLSKRVDLGTLLRDGIPPVAYLPGDFSRRMVYDVGVTGFTGHPESGKTSLVCQLSLDAMRQGRHVVYFDYENGENEAARRFMALGASAELLSEFLLYIPFPGAPDWQQMGALWSEFPNAIAVWDSTRGILRTLGINEDKANEVARFMDPLVEFTITHNTASIIIDHVTKATTEVTGYSRGSGDKLAAVQAQWYVKRTKPFSEVEVGEIELHRWKARSGGLAHEFRFSVGDGKGHLAFQRLDPDVSVEGRVETAIIAYLRERGESASKNEVETAVVGKASEVREALTRLAEDEARPVVIENSGQHPRFAYSAELDKEPQAALDF